MNESGETVKLPDKEGVIPDVKNAVPSDHTGRTILQSL